MNRYKEAAGFWSIESLKQRNKSLHHLGIYFGEILLCVKKIC